MMIMYKAVVLFLAIFLTILFVNYKYSQGIRIMAYGEVEPKNEAIMAFILQIVVSFLWTLYFCVYV